jgi:hypothetical protein
MDTLRHARLDADSGLWVHPYFPHFLPQNPLDLCQCRGRVLKIYVLTGLARHFLVCCIKPVTGLNVSWTSASDKRLPPPPGALEGTGQLSLRSGR